VAGGVDFLGTCPNARGTWMCNWLDSDLKAEKVRELAWQSEIPSTALKCNEILV
jgi:hypothetical protein